MSVGNAGDTGLSVFTILLLNNNPEDAEVADYEGEN